jgi:glutamate-ammonia-ligase adenylyltransferase
MTRPDRDIAAECSPFLAEMIRRQPRRWSAMEESGRLEDDAPPSSDILAGMAEVQGLDAALRRFRNLEMMRIIWRDLNRAAALEQTLSDLSRLAEICLQRAVKQHCAELEDRYGTPRNDDGQAMRLVVIGMGKLGGGELNLSSDVDLMFCYPQAGTCDGPLAFG